MAVFDKKQTKIAVSWRPIPLKLVYIVAVPKAPLEKF